MTDDARARAAATDEVTLVRPDERVAGHPTPGMVREQAVDVHGMWAGWVRTAPGATSGWHHHGDHETTIYVAAGSLVMESGPGGAVRHAAEAGDFLRVPPWAVHRESNPGAAESALVVVRAAGTTEAVTNVDGPAPAG